MISICLWIVLTTIKCMVKHIYIAIKDDVPVKTTTTTLIGFNENSIETLGVIKINLTIDTIF